MKDNNKVKFQLHIIFQVNCGPEQNTPRDTLTIFLPITGDKVGRAINKPKFRYVMIGIKSFWAQFNHYPSLTEVKKYAQ